MKKTTLCCGIDGVGTRIDVWWIDAIDAYILIDAVEKETSTKEAKRIICVKRTHIINFNDRFCSFFNGF